MWRINAINVRFELTQNVFTFNVEKDIRKKGLKILCGSLVDFSLGYINPFTHILM